MSDTAIVLLSGGLDSCVLLKHAIGIFGASNVKALSFDYQQKSRKELKAARAIAKECRVGGHVEIDVSSCFDPGRRSASSLLSGFYEDQIKPNSLYVPGRNLIFLSIATSVAQSFGDNHIFAAFVSAGYNQDGDRRGFPDAGPEFAQSFQEVLFNLADDRPIILHTPFTDLTKDRVISLGISIGAPLHLTTSCYFPKETWEECGECEACVQRRDAFQVIDLPDPALRDYWANFIGSS